MKLLDKRNWWVYLVVFVHIIKLAPPTSYLCFNNFLTSLRLMLPIFWLSFWEFSL